MKFVKEFILNYGRKIIDISFLLSFVVATIAFFCIGSRLRYYICNLYFYMCDCSDNRPILHNLCFYRH